ncbi:DUF1667 domain-containing protein [Niameybacter massiliensis]|uniref:DUF1667 domain-containing protein n=1 Tax=Holtiella tumoricola TaxID=3018743 RepID=A0AA42DP56_9FIRM|nr:MULTISPECIES: DUF1667 domain-containing protein [Lachnospirales]MDA3732997.1 DUF1667 domain-containing protein [Holtiella tumoricola]
MERQLICIVCPKGCRLTVSGEETLSVTGNTCPKGAEYGVKEVTAPTRVVTSTVKIEGSIHPTLPVKTNGDIPKQMIPECMEVINSLTVQSPVKMGDVLVADLLGTGVELVASRDQ